SESPRAEGEGGAGRAQARNRRVGGDARAPACDQPVSLRVKPATVRLGILANLAQFSLLVGVNALVGGMIGQERTVLPLLAEQAFGLAAVTASLTFIVAFGLTKPVANLLAGALSDRV